MKKPYVIAINAVSGGGKTALAKLLASSLPKASLFCFDDLDASNLHPADFYEWTKRGSDLLEFDCQGIAEAVGNEIAGGSSEFIVLDYPFGRDHPRFQNQIDLSVFIDTPLDIALARRVLRDHLEIPDISAEERLKGLKGEMSHYIDKARHVYLGACRRKDTCDLVLDGWTSLEKLRDKIVAHIMAKQGIQVFNQ